MGHGVTSDLSLIILGVISSQLLLLPLLLWIGEERGYSLCCGASFILCEEKIIAFKVYRKNFNKIRDFYYTQSSAPPCSCHTMSFLPLSTKKNHAYAQTLVTRPFISRAWVGLGSRLTSGYLFSLPLFSATSGQTKPLHISKHATNSSLCTWLNISHASHQPNTVWLEIFKG